jgi:choline dehydrogenase-like flavoprotein
MEVDVIIIGTGFGASVAVTKLLEKTPNATIHMLERGLWWFTSERPLPKFLTDQNKTEPKRNPIQYWPRPNHARGVVDMLSVVKTNNPTIEGFRSFIEGIGSFITGEKRPQPLYRYNMFKDIDIVTASGVGGGSLIYANVSIEPHLDAATQTYPVMNNWPLKLMPQDYTSTTAGKEGAIDWMTKKRGKRHKVVTRFPLPDELNLKPEALDGDHEFLYLGKSRALRDAQNVSGADWKRVKDWKPLDLQVNDYDTTAQTADFAGKNAYCERQGRCIQGCLPGARHTLNKTLINQVLSVKPNVTLESLADVSHISLKTDGRYEVTYKDGRDGNEKSHIAKIVIVAAGTLGSTNILLRSHDKGTLKLSGQRGQRFSTNGDFAGFVVNAQKKVADVNKRYGMFPTRGPINTSHVMFTTNDGKVQVNVEDGGIPPMLAPAVAAALRVVQEAQNRDTFMKQLRGAFLNQSLPDFQQWFPIHPDPANPTRFQTEDEMLSTPYLADQFMQNVFYFNCMGTDDSTGVFKLNNGRLDLTFSDSPAAQRVYKVTEEIIQAMAAQMGGDYVPWFTWKGFQNRKLVTVHPLGGCPMGNSPTEGVVNTKGQVFRVDSAAPAKQVYDNLYVMDASIIPGPIGVNPTLTIVGLALKIVEGIQL